MIDKKSLNDFIEERLEGSDLFLVDLRVTPANEITVEIDSDGSIDIDRCVELTREIHDAFPTDEEDYELEVGSAGLTSPLKVPRQYLKYIGEDVEVLTSDGRKLRGVLKSADGSGFTIEIEEKVKKEGAKRPVIEKADVTFPYTGVKYTKYLLQF